MTYSAKTYDLPPLLLESLKRQAPWRDFASAAWGWLTLYALVRGFLWLKWWWLYPLAIFLIAGRAGVFLQLTHEAAHGLVGGKRLNAFFGNWIAAYPIGLDLKGYAEPHLRHHACANRACDPIGDREKYRVCDPRDRRLWGLLLKDACGWTAIRGRYLYANAGANREEAQVDYDEIGEDYYPREAQVLSAAAAVHPRVDRVPQVQPHHLDRAKTLGGITLVQILIVAVIFRFDILSYLLLWLIPLATAHMVLMRIRGIGEHGLPSQLGLTMADFDGKQENGTLYTRSFGTPRSAYRLLPLVWLERALIGSLNVWAHHAHHLFPKVPYYHLPHLDNILSEQILRHNPHAYIPGYVAALREAGRLRSKSTS